MSFTTARPLRYLPYKGLVRVITVGADSVSARLRYLTLPQVVALSFLNIIILSKMRKISVNKGFLVVLIGACPFGRGRRHDDPILGVGFLTISLPPGGRWHFRQKMTEGAGG